MGARRAPRRAVCSLSLAGGLDVARGPRAGTASQICERLPIAVTDRNAVNFHLAFISSKKPNHVLHQDALTGSGATEDDRRRPLNTIKVDATQNRALTKTLSQALNTNHISKPNITGARMTISR